MGKLWQSTTTGLTTPTTWQLVQTTNYGGNTTVWDGNSTVYASSGSAGISAANTALDFNVDFSPDGSSTGATLFVTDSAGAHRWRVLVYKATGTSYDRENW
jgi:hypothetical protein